MRTIFLLLLCNVHVFGFFQFSLKSATGELRTRKRRDSGVAAAAAAAATTGPSDGVDGYHYGESVASTGILKFIYIYKYYSHIVFSYTYMNKTWTKCIALNCNKYLRR